MKKVRRAVVAAIVAAAMVTVAGGLAEAGLQAPAWMPNSPIMAGTQVILLWMPVPNAVKYNVYLDGKKVGESATVQYTLVAPNAAGEYKVELAGVDAGGAEGAKSQPGIIRIITIEPPASLIARVADEKVHLRWDKTKGAMIYNVFRGEKENGDYKMIASVQGEGYTDGEAAKGKVHYYAVSAKDLAGKESKRTRPYMVSLVKAAMAEEVVKVSFKAVPSEETARVGFLGGKRVLGLSDIKLERSTGELWVVFQATIYRVKADGAIAGQVGPVEGVEKFIKMDFGPDGSIYASDLRGNLYRLDRSGAVRWKAPAPKPPLDDPEIWQGIPPQVRTNYGPTGGDVLCLENEIWMTDQMFGLIYVFDYSGKFQRYVYKYTDSKGKAERFAAVGEVERLKDGNLLLTFPLAHYASVVDKDFKEKFSIGKAGSGFVGRFIGIAGVSETPDGNILLSDPGVNSMQVFDGKTGEYRHHIGGAAAKEDPAQPGRAFLDFGAVAYAGFLDAKTLYVYTGSERAILFLKLK